MLTDNKKAAAISRLNRAQGQIKAVGRMIEEDRTCEEILIQLRAARAALKAIEDGLFEQHLRVCLIGTAELTSGSKQEKKIEEIMRTLKKFFKRKEIVMPPTLNIHNSFHKIHYRAIY